MALCALPSFCLGHSGAGEDTGLHLAFLSCSVPDSLAPASLPWPCTPALGRSQILWPPSECNLAENFHLDRTGLAHLPPSSGAEVLALWPFLCGDPLLPRPVGVWRHGWRQPSCFDLCGVLTKASLLCCCLNPSLFPFEKASNEILLCAGPCGRC